MQSSFSVGVLVIERPDTDCVWAVRETGGDVGAKKAKFFNVLCFFYPFVVPCLNSLNHRRLRMPKWKQIKQRH